jgi:DNA-binding NarL/FixJ family response regulator
MNAVASVELPMIMVVEDEPDALEQRTSVLVGLKCATIGSRSEEEAVEKMSDGPVDLVLTDIRLKVPRDDKSGVEFARYVKRTYQDVPVIGYSARFADKDLAPTDKDIFDEVWPKDLDFEQIDELMQRCRALASAHYERRRAALWELFLRSDMFDMRTISASTTVLPDLSEREEAILRYVAEGLAPREIVDRVEIDEDELYRFVGWVLDEIPPEPSGETMNDVHRRHGSRPASAAELEEFARQYGPSLPAEDEG